MPLDHFPRPFIETQPGLGDAVLGLVIAEELHRSWNLEEGGMAKVRAAVVNESALADIAVDLGLGRVILLGRGEAEYQDQVVT